MPDVGDRVQVSAKSGTRQGVVRSVSGALVTVEWDTGGQTTVIPAPGVMSVIGGARKAPSGARKAAKKKAPPAKKKAAPAKKPAPAKKKAAPAKKKGAAKKAGAAKRGKKAR